MHCRNIPWHMIHNYVHRCCVGTDIFRIRHHRCRHDHYICRGHSDRMGHYCSHDGNQVCRIDRIVPDSLLDNYTFQSTWPVHQSYPWQLRQAWHCQGTRCLVRSKSRESWWPWCWTIHSWNLWHSWKDSIRILDFRGVWTCTLASKNLKEM